MEWRCDRADRLTEGQHGELASAATSWTRLLIRRRRRAREKDVVSFPSQASELRFRRSLVDVHYRSVRVWGFGARDNDRS